MCDISLEKNHDNISLDLKNLQKELEANPKAGIYLGNNCYKIRVSNSSIPTGKSGGFRVVYYHIDQKGVIYLMSIFSKSDMENISDEEILNTFDILVNKL